MTHRELTDLLNRWFDEWDALDRTKPGICAFLATKLLAAGLIVER